MDQVTQQNAALVEEAAAAADSLKQQAANLAQVVSVFKIAGASAVAHAMPVARPVAAPAFVERRGPNRAKNVTRPKFGGGDKEAKPSTAVVDRSAAPQKTGTDDWETF